MSLFFLFFVGCEMFQAYECTCATTGDTGEFLYSTCSTSTESEVLSDAEADCAAEGGDCSACTCEIVSAC